MAAGSRGDGVRLWGEERGESRSFLRGRKGGVLARRGAVACGGVSRRVMDVKSE